MKTPGMDLGNSSWVSEEDRMARSIDFTTPLAYNVQTTFRTTVKQACKQCSCKHSPNSCRLSTSVKFSVNRHGINRRVNELFLYLRQCLTLAFEILSKASDPKYLTTTEIMRVVLTSYRNLPNVFLSIAYFVASSKARCANPTAPDAT